MSRLEGELETVRVTCAETWREFEDIIYMTSSLGQRFGGIDQQKRFKLRIRCSYYSAVTVEVVQIAFSTNSRSLGMITLVYLRRESWDSSVSLALTNGLVYKCFFRRNGGGTTDRALRGLFEILTPADQSYVKCEMPEQPTSKKRKLRKGTHSCWECKRRKARCIFSTGDDTICVGCRRRGTNCVNQEESDNEPETKDSATNRRLSRIEGMLATLLERQAANDQTSAKPAKSPVPDFPSWRNDT